MSFTTQVFANGEVVAQPNMDSTITNPTQVVNAYFPVTPCIMGGIGNIFNNFGQSGTSNAFTFLAGNFRFPNQVGQIGSEAYFTAGDYAGATVSITWSSDLSSQYYIVAALQQSTIDDWQYSSTATILSTALTLAQIALSPNQYVTICAITNTDGVYNVFLDSNCAYNYGVAILSTFLDIGDNLSTGAVVIGGRVAGAPVTLTMNSVAHAGVSAHRYVSDNIGQLIRDDVLANDGGFVFRILGVSPDGITADLSWEDVIYETDATTQNTGISGAYGARPKLLGTLTGMGALATTSGSIATLGDIPALPIENVYYASVGSGPNGITVTVTYSYYAVATGNTQYYNVGISGNYAIDITSTGAFAASMTFNEMGFPAGTIAFVGSRGSINLDTPNSSITAFMCYINATANSLNISGSASSTGIIQGAFSLVCRLSVVVV